MSAQEDARHAAEWQQRMVPYMGHAPQAAPAVGGSNPAYAQQMQYFQYYGGYYDAQQQWIQGQAPQP